MICLFRVSNSKTYFVLFLLKKKDDYLVLQAGNEVK